MLTIVRYYVECLSQIVLFKPYNETRGTYSYYPRVRDEETETCSSHWLEVTQLLDERARALSHTLYIH